MSLINSSLRPENWIYFISCIAKCIFRHFHAMMISKDYKRQIRNFFKHIPNVLAFFVVFSTQILSLFSPDPWFCINQPFCLKNDKLSSYLSALDFWHSLAWNFEFDELDFFYTLNWIFAAWVACKNSVQTRNLIFQTRTSQKSSAYR